MADPIYVVSRIQALPARFDLSDEELKALWDSMTAAFKDVGGEHVLNLGLFAGGLVMIDTYPDAQALRALNKAYFDLCVPRYWRVTSDVGVRVEIPVARSAS